MRAAAATPGSACVSRAGERVLAIANFSFNARLFSGRGTQREDCFGGTPLPLRSGQASTVRGTGSLLRRAIRTMVGATVMLTTSASCFAQADPASEPAVLAVGKVLPAV